jgi:pyruvate dehydrogenase E2 component (dihydrolipoamide acetyltransferase)
MKGQPLTGWRRIASAVWGPPSDPQIYGMLEVDAGALLEFIRQARASGHHVTPTHLAGRALAQALLAVPSLNVRLIGSRAVPRHGIDIFFITSVGKGHDLTGAKIDDIDRKSALDVAAELDAKSSALKSGQDPHFAKAKRLMDRLPRPLLRLALRVSAWLAGRHATSIPVLGVSRTPFGSAMVSSVGMLGLPMGFTPLSWMYTVPAIVLLGEIVDKPVAVAGRVEVRPVLPITATIDHRYADGADLGRGLKAFREYLENPSAFERASCSPEPASIRGKQCET